MPRRLVNRGQKKRQMSEGVSSQHTSNQTASASDAPSAHGLLNVTWQGNNIVIVERTEEGGILVRQRRAEYSCFIKNDLDVQTVNVIRSNKACIGLLEEGEWLRVLWSGTREREQLCAVLEKDGIQTYEGDINPVRRFMADTKLPQATPRSCLLDIETDSRVPIRLAAEGGARILCWCIIDQITGEKKLGVLDENTDTSERALLQRMFKILEGYDQICAWSGDRFDFPAIRGRCEKRRIGVNFDRWLWLDQLEIFKRMNTMAAESGEEKASYALNAIATAILGVGKDDFDASKTWEAWEAGGDQRRIMVRYCVQDTDLLRQIEDKTGYIGLLQTIAETCNVFADTRGANPTIQAEGFLLELAMKQGYKFPSSFSRSFGDKYKGAYVMEPQRTGIIKNVHVGDFASLYPSIIVTWNMSPETIVTGQELIELEQAIELEAPVTNSYSYSPLTDKYFRTDKEGILPQAVKAVMGLRTHWSELKASLPPGTPEWVQADRKSSAYKMVANSFYGVVGSSMSRFYNRDVAESITQAGKWLILETIRVGEAKGLESIYGDTDSLFIAGCTRSEFSSFVAYCNKDVYPEALKDLGCKENTIKLAYEKEFERIIFTAAKKYVGRYIHYKGTDADDNSKPEVKGLEYKRGDSNRLTRIFQAEVVDRLVGMINGGCEEVPVFQEIVNRWQTKIVIDPLELDDIMISKRMNMKLKEYVRKRKKDGSWAKQLPHIELARKLEEDGEYVAEGTKISYFIYDASDSTNKIYRLATDWDGTYDQYEMWEKFVWPPTLRLLAAAFPDAKWTDYSKVRPKVQRVSRKP